MIPPKGLKSSEKLTKKPPLEIHSCLVYMDVSENGGTQQLLVLLLKMTILGCFGSTPIFGNIHIYIYLYIYIYICHQPWPVGLLPVGGWSNRIFPPPSPKSQNPWRTILTSMRSNSFWTMPPLGEEIHPIFVEFSRRLFFFSLTKNVDFPGMMVPWRVCCDEFPWKETPSHFSYPGFVRLQDTLDWDGNLFWKHAKRCVLDLPNFVRCRMIRLL